MAVVLDYVMNLPESHYRAIGEFMFRYAQLETQLHEILWRVTNIDNRLGRVLTIGADTSVVRAMLRTAIGSDMRGVWLPADQKRFIQGIGRLLNGAKEHAVLRNKLAHCSWQSPVKGDHSDAQLVFMKEYNEKYLARVDRAIDDAYLRERCRRLKSLNIAAQELILDISGFRGIDASNFHRRKYLR